MNRNPGKEKEDMASARWGLLRTRSTVHRVANNESIPEHTCLQVGEEKLLTFLVTVSAESSLQTHLQSPWYRPSHDTIFSRFLESILPWFRRTVSLRATLPVDRISSTHGAVW